MGCVPPSTYSLVYPSLCKFATLALTQLLPEDAAHELLDVILSVRRTRGQARNNKISTVCDKHGAARQAGAAVQLSCHAVPRVSTALCCVARPKGTICRHRLYPSVSRPHKSGCIH